MQFRQRLVSYLSDNHVPFTMEHTEDITPCDTPARTEQSAASFVQADLAFVNNHLVMLVLRADQEIDAILLQRAFAERNVTIIDQVSLRPAFPDVDLRFLPPLGAFWQMPVYIDGQLAGDQRFRFYAGSAQDIVTIRRADFDRLNHPVTVQIAAGGSDSLVSRPAAGTTMALDVRGGQGLSTLTTTG